MQKWSTSFLLYNFGKLEKTDFYICIRDCKIAIDKSMKKLTEQNDGIRATSNELSFFTSEHGH